MPTTTTTRDDPARCEACGALNDRSNDECVACFHPRDDRPTAADPITAERRGR